MKDVSILYENDLIKPVFSGHQTFPLRYGWLKKVYDACKSLDAKDVFNSPESVSSFGVGKNMVSAMRYWAVQTGILHDNKITPEADKFFSDTGLDPWMENPTTLWMLHWKMVCQPHLVTYHWFFNYYNGGAFDAKFINTEIDELCIKKEWRRPSRNTLKRDVDCFVRMYAGEGLSSLSYDDDSIEAPFSELSLIRPISKQGFYAPNRGPKATLSVGMFMLALATFWEEYSILASSLSIESILYNPTSPGRVFLLDETGLLEKIHSLPVSFSEKINWSETAGMRQLTIDPRSSLSEVKSMALSLMESEYE